MIYFVRSLKTGYIKIGMTIDMQQRVRQLSTEYGKVELLGTIPGGRAFETALHMAFDAYLVEGMGREWFRDNDDLRKYINRYAKMPEQFRRERPIPIKPPAYDRGVNCHLYDVFMQRREQRGFENLTLEDIQQSTGVPLRMLRSLVQNKADRFDNAAMDALMNYFGCDVNDMLKLGKTEPAD